ncbi:Holliday junction endonuclease RuvC [Kytococcus aerolatus]|uniref:Crossover junction endodeoxyribonuclease RuvC n=1 Tax=Kytococcus aerolatus TaxID=592308 RepID=A0A212T2Q3_9MICO|nr:crossover junction endodeoxyribonuclease RuvC [Kytococcus aerolatus]SNC60323.1 Holliday junction endonuclease RuvC [Kytococcus aerolatus]
MRVLGVDPGLTRCGLGVVEGRRGGTLRMVAVDVVRTAPEVPLEQRLLAVSQRIEAWIAEHGPDAVAVERIFARSDVSTIMGTVQASGLALVAAARAGVEVGTHTPSEVKAAVCGNGRADKAQVTAMVTRILALDSPPRPADAADALAVGIAQIWRGGGQRRLDAAAGTGRPVGAGWDDAVAAQAPARQRAAERWAEAERRARQSTRRSR